MELKLNQEVVITSGPWKGEVGIIVGEGWSKNTIKVKCEDQYHPYMVDKKCVRVRN